MEFDTYQKPSESTPSTTPVISVNQKFASRSRSRSTTPSTTTIAPSLNEITNSEDRTSIIRSRSRSRYRPGTTAAPRIQYRRNRNEYRVRTTIPTTTTTTTTTTSTKKPPVEIVALSDPKRASDFPADDEEVEYYYYYYDDIEPGDVFTKSQSQRSAGQIHTGSSTTTTTTTTSKPVNNFNRGHNRFSNSKVIQKTAKTESDRLTKSNEISKRGKLAAQKKNSKASSNQVEQTRKTTAQQVASSNFDVIGGGEQKGVAKRNLPTEAHAFNSFESSQPFARNNGNANSKVSNGFKLDEMPKWSQRAVVPLSEKVRYNPEDGSVFCLDKGIFPHPISCQLFVHCAPSEENNGSIRSWVYSCPKLLTFDPIGQMCNWSPNSKLSPNGNGCIE